MRCGKNYWRTVAFTFCTTFKRAIKRPKSDPRLFSRIYSSMDKLWSYQEKKLLIFSLLCKGVQGKRKLLSIRGFTLLIRANNYETAVSKTSLLKTITDPLKEIKMVKTDLKKVPSQIIILLVPLVTIAQLFTKKKLPTSQSL